MIRQLSIGWGIVWAIFGILEKIGRLIADPSEMPRTPEVKDVNSQASSSTKNAVLVLDASPSMDSTDWKPSRLRAAKKAAREYVTRLASDAPNTLVAVVAFSGNAQVVCPPTPACNARRLHRAIDRIETSSSTNITAGLKETDRLLRGTKGACQVVLLTDGHHNGATSPGKIAKAVRAVATLEIVGIGGSPEDVDERLLKRIASKYPDDKPRYRWIGEKERLVKEFQNLAGRLARA